MILVIRRSKGNFFVNVHGSSLIVSGILVGKFLEKIWKKLPIINSSVDPYLGSLLVFWGQKENGQTAKLVVIVLQTHQKYKEKINIKYS
jgi:hypothetical protein